MNLSFRHTNNGWHTAYASHRMGFSEFCAECRKKEEDEKKQWWWWCWWRRRHRQTTMYKWEMRRYQSCYFLGTHSSIIFITTFVHCPIYFTSIFSIYFPALRCCCCCFRYDRLVLKHRNHCDPDHWAESEERKGTNQFILSIAGLHLHTYAQNRAREPILLHRLLLLSRSRLLVYELQVIKGK